MPTASITFDLVHERYEHLCAIHGKEIQRGAQDLDNWLRNLLKHGEISQWTAETLASEVRNRLLNDVILVEE